LLLLLVMTMRPVLLLEADPAPLRLAVLVVLAGLAVALEAVVGAAVDVVDRLVGAVLVAEAGGVADVVLPRLVEALEAVDGLPVDVVGADFLVALAAVGGDPDELPGRDLAEAAVAAGGPEQQALLVLVLAADGAGLGVDALVLLGDDDVAGVAVPGNLMQVAGAGLAAAELAGRGQAAAVAAVDVHVALRAPAGALFGRAVVFGEDTVDGPGLGIAAAAGGTGREGQERDCREAAQHHDWISTTKEPILARMGFVSIY